MKQTIMSLMLVGFVLLATGTGTYAYFSDSETSTGNEFMAGTFALDISNGNSLPLQTANIMPGWPILSDGSFDSNSVTTHGVTNVGTVPGEVYLIARNFTEPSGFYAEVSEVNGGIEVGPMDFADVMYIKVSANLNGDYYFTSNEVIYDGSLRDLHTKSFSLAPDEYMNLKFEAYMPMDLNDMDNTYEDTTSIPVIDGNEDDNAYQADGVMCEIVFMGTTEITIGNN